MDTIVICTAVAYSPVSVPIIALGINSTRYGAHKQDPQHNSLDSKNGIQFLCARQFSAFVSVRLMGNAVFVFLVYDSAC